MIKKKNLLNYCGLLGVAAFLSYTAVVVFSPLAYPGYDWMAQAVSDLSASNAPSLRLWNQLSSLYNVCTLVCAMMVCLGIQKKGTRLLRSGIYHVTEFNHYFRDKKQKLSFLWYFCWNSTWNDDGWCIRYEHCSERVFGNS